MPVRAILAHQTRPLFTLIGACLISLMLVVSSYGQSVSEAKPFLWELTDSNGELKAYLFGTIHSGNPDVNQLAPSVDQAFKRSNTFLAELALTPKTLTTIQQRMLKTEKRPLVDILGATRTLRANRLLAYFHPNLSVDLFANMKLWAFVANLAVLEDQVRYPNLPAMDSQFYQRALSDGKATAGLETPLEQTSVFEAFSEQELLAMLDANMQAMEDAHRQGDSLMQQLYRAYLSGDPVVFDQLMEEQVPIDQTLAAKLDKLLLTDRNQRMAARIEDALSQFPTPLFIAIGAAHYGPDLGVQHLLAKKGFSIHRVNH